MRIIDTHLHVSKGGFRGSETTGTLPDVLGYLERNSIEKGIILANNFGSGRNNLENNDVLEIVEKYENLYGMLTFLPSASKEEIDILISEVLENPKIVGFKIYPSYNHFYLDTPTADYFLSRCEYYRIPILFHFGRSNKDDANRALENPQILFEPLKKYPILKVIIAHIGFPHIEATMACISRHKHVYTDISGLFSKEMYSEETDGGRVKNTLQKLFDSVDSRKILFGSDYPIADYETYQKIIDSLNLSEEIKEMIFFKNAMKLFFRDRQFLIAPTTRCNRDCSFCSSNHTGLQSEMSVEDCLELIKKNKKEGYTSMMLYGGEPSIYKEISMLIDYAKSIDLQVVVISNGLLCIKNTNIDEVSIHLEKPPLAKIILKNLRKYEEIGIKKIYGTIFISSDFKIKELRSYLEDEQWMPLSEIKLLIDQLAEQETEIIQKLQEVIYYIRSFSDIRIEIVSPIKKCLINEALNEIENLEFSSACLPVSPLYGKDGRNICRILTVKTNSKQETFDIFERFKNLRLLKNKECRTCNDFKNRTCFGGCFWDLLPLYKRIYKD